MGIGGINEKQKRSSIYRFALAQPYSSRGLYQESPVCTEKKPVLRKNEFKRSGRAADTKDIAEGSLWNRADESR
jgi:hypothetical protein